MCRASDALSRPNDAVPGRNAVLSRAEDNFARANAVVQARPEVMGGWFETLSRRIEARLTAPSSTAPRGPATRHHREVAFGSPEGHNLVEGTSDRRAGARRWTSSSSPMDARLRFRLVSPVLPGDPVCEDQTTVVGALDETSSVGFDVLRGSYSSLFFHRAKVMAAILRASVSFARLGLVPAASIRS